MGVRDEVVLDLKTAGAGWPIRVSYWGFRNASSCPRLTHPPAWLSSLDWALLKPESTDQCYLNHSSEPPGFEMSSPIWESLFRLPSLKIAPSLSTGYKESPHPPHLGKVPTRKRFENHRLLLSQAHSRLPHPTNGSVVLVGEDNGTANRFILCGLSGL